MRSKHKDDRRRIVPQGSRPARCPGSREIAVVNGFSISRGNSSPHDQATSALIVRAPSMGNAPLPQRQCVGSFLIHEVSQQGRCTLIYTTLSGNTTRARRRRPWRCRDARLVVVRAPVAVVDPAAVRRARRRAMPLFIRVADAADVFLREAQDGHAARRVQRRGGRRLVVSDFPGSPGWRCACRPPRPR